MGVLSKLGSWIGGAFRGLLSWVGRIVRRWWPVIVLVVVAYYAGPISSYLEGLGAPAWMVGAVKALAPLGAAIAKYGKAIAAAWAALGEVSAWYQFAVVMGAMILFAPEEAKVFFKEVAEELRHGVTALTKLGGQIFKELAEVVAGSLLPYVLVGIGAYAILSGGEHGE